MDGRDKPNDANDIPAPDEEPKPDRKVRTLNDVLDELFGPMP